MYQQQQQQSLFVPQKLQSVDINTKSYRGKVHSHLEIAKLIELSGWAKRKKFANTLHIIGEAERALTFPSPSLMTCINC